MVAALLYILRVAIAKVERPDDAHVFFEEMPEHVLAVSMVRLVEVFADTRPWACQSRGEW